MPSRALLTDVGPLVGTREMSRSADGHMPFPSMVPLPFQGQPPTLQASSANAEQPHLTAMRRHVDQVDGTGSDAVCRFADLLLRRNALIRVRRNALIRADHSHGMSAG